MLVCMSPRLLIDKLKTDFTHWVRVEGETMFDSDIGMLAQKYGQVKFQRIRRCLSSLPNSIQFADSSLLP